MITWGRFDRSPCYWGKYTTLSGEGRFLHASVMDIKFYAKRYGLLDDITPLLLSNYFHHTIKAITDSATFSRNTAKIKRVHLAREVKLSPSSLKLLK